MAETKGEVFQAADVERGSETVLIVEDDPVIGSLTAAVLRICGHPAMEAIDGEEAIRVFAENRDLIDLVILDVVMPKKSGKEAYEEIRKVRPDAKVIIRSGHSTGGDILQGHGKEMVDFVTKPAPLKLLLQTIRELLARQTSISEDERAAAG
jgi:DNA-binding response OmpR family regulator